MGAAPKRIKALADALYSEGFEVEVNCPLPNYPEGKIFEEYRNKIFITENIDGVKVRRYWCYPSISSNKVIRLFSMLSFAVSLFFSLFKYLRNRQELFIIQSPPLFVAFSSIIVSKILRVPVLLNVSDIWPLSALELGVLKKGKFYSLLEKVERFNYTNSEYIMGQSKEILSHVENFVQKPTLLYRNLPNFKSSQKITLDEKFEIKSDRKIKIIYAGLLGVAQKVYDICKSIDFGRYNCEFHIYGKGNEKEIIEEFAKKNDNIFYRGSVSAEQIQKIIPNYDISIVPLATSIYGAVPSKIYELIKLNTPIILMGVGEAAELIHQNEIGYVCNPSSYDELESILFNLNLEKLKKLQIKLIEINNTHFDFDIQKKELVAFINDNIFNK